MNEEKDKSFIEPQNFIFNAVTAVFTTRSAGENINVTAKVNDISKEKIYLPIQKHTDKIHIIDSDLEPVIADAVITQKKGILIGVRVADCVPILLYDRINRVTGAVHAGWRGTAGEILKKAIRTMCRELGSAPEDILIAIGPSIRKCCYDIGDEVKDSIVKATGEGDYFSREGEKYFIDLASANRIQALSMGIPQENIWLSSECTFCNPEKFYSYRYSKETTGRQGGFIGMW